VNYFTSLNLNDRSSQLAGLLDGISNGIQTIQAGSQGIDAISKLVQSLQSTIKQAQSDNAANRPTTVGNATSGAITVGGKIGGTTYTGSKSAKDIALDTQLGGAGAAASYNATTGVTTDASLGIGTSMTLSISAGDTTFVSTTLTGTSTVRDLVNEINRSGIATASIDSSGKLNVTGTGSDTLKIGIAAGTDAAALAAAQADTGNSNQLLGLPMTTGATGIPSSGGNSTVRTNLISQFNDLAKQIDQLAKDAGYNGKNLLTGDKLSIIFNEKTGANQSKIDIQGETITAANLGILTAVSGTATAGQSFNIQDDTSLNNMADVLTGALGTLRSISSTLGSNLSVVQTRQDFTKNLINTLTTGADNLVLADPNEEGAKLLALNTRQQLSQTALSLANQADQGVLRLFG
jgi:flagellin-like hook-associated protein FlgL